MERPKSSFSYYCYETREPDHSCVRDTVVLASSRPLGWDGVTAEMGRSRSWEPIGVALDGHYLAINLDGKPLPMEDRSSARCRRVTLPPGSFQVTPAATPFSLRILKPSHYGGLEISLSKIRQLLGCDLQVQPQLAMVDEPLAEVVRPLLAEVARRGSSGPLYSDGLLIAVASRLARLFGCSPATSLPVGALSAARLTLVIEAIEDRIDQRLTVVELAAVAGLSPAHFAREFKRATRETPHVFVTRKRLERARQLLLYGSSITDAALRCGFNDQAHLSRAFKGKFGVSPGAFARTARGKYGRRR